jgi:ABC-type polysaccharide/polyol phosphate export permease
VTEQELSERPALSRRRFAWWSSRNRPQWVDVLLALTRSDIRLRYGRGHFRFVRWQLEAFALVGVYLVFVVVILKRPGHATGLSLACAVVPFQLVMMSVTSALSSITARRSILLNMAFQRTLIPAAAVLTETIAFAASFTVFVVMMAVYRIPPTLELAWLPLVLLENVALALSFAYPMALFGLWYRESRPLAISVIRTMFFLAPSLVAPATTSGTSWRLLQLNPLTGLFEAYRAIFVYGRPPTAWDVLYPLAFAGAVAAISVPIYRREEPQFAKVVE